MRVVGFLGKEAARFKIIEAEKELGPLSDGMRRDLLMDNFPYASRDRINELVFEIREEGLGGRRDSQRDSLPR